ncbi:ABC transporter permease [Streptomyces palmae]|uniref:ABC transporter permease n=2 Tax=Streptomyces palmae TaxID=1701085 RepID=A0A4Z0GLV8_9ACTN|nr:ABC transporter permease [Streptomyces palmae]
MAGPTPPGMPGAAPASGMPGAPGAPGYAAYTSPIPIRPTNLGHALRSEWTKIKSVRSTMWTLGVLIALVVGIGFATAAGLSNSNLEGNSPLTFGFVGVLLGMLCVITLGVLVISSEYGTGMIRTTLTACPSRSRVLGAKAVVFFLLTFVVMAACTLVTALIDDSLLSGNEGAVEATGEDWFKAVVGVSTFVALLGLLALYVGALIRHSAGAITIMIGVVLLPLVLAIFMQAGALHDVRDALLEYSVPNQLTVLYDNGASPNDSGPQGWDPLLIITGVTAVAMLGAHAAIEKRDV